MQKKNYQNCFIQFFFRFYFSYNFLLSQLYRTIIFARVITRIRMRPFQLKSGEKYRMQRMLHGRKVNFTSCNFAALHPLVQQTLHSVKITYFPPSYQNILFLSYIILFTFKEKTQF